MNELIIQIMTLSEALDWKEHVGRSALELRNLLFEGYKREAWRALGFHTWTDCIKGLADEYGITERRLWQLHQANQIEAVLTEQSSVATIPEGHLRPLTKLDPDQQREAWQQAVETAPTGKITAAHVEKIVDEIESGPSPKMAVHYSSDKDDWETPQELFDILEEEFNFTLDVCATHDNTKVSIYYSPEVDGLKQKWEGTCWMNPPYGREIYSWIQKAYHAAYYDGATIVCLVPARVDTSWWWDFCIRGEIRFMRGRLKFGGGDSGAPFPSAIVIFRPEMKREVIWWNWKLS